MKKTKRCEDCTLLEEDDLKMYCPALGAELVFSLKVPIEEIDCPLWNPNYAKKFGRTLTCSLCSSPAKVLQRLGDTPTFRCTTHLSRKSTWIVYIDSTTNPMKAYERMKKGIEQSNKKIKKKDVVLSETEKKALELITEHKEIVIASMPKEYRGTLGKLKDYNLVVFGTVSKRLDQYQVRELKTVRVKGSLENLFS